MPLYPMPRPEDDQRFTTGLALKVAEVLAAHGFPKPREGSDFLRLQLALFTFLYQPTAIEIAALNELDAKPNGVATLVPLHLVKSGGR